MIKNMNTKKFEQCIERASKIAQAHRHELVTTEHILYALLEDKTITDIFKGCGADPEAIKQDLNNFLLNPDNLPISNLISQGITLPRRTKNVNTLISSAVTRVLAANKSVIEPADLLVEFLEEEDNSSFALYFVKKHDINALKIKSYLSHNIMGGPNKGTDLETTENGQSATIPKNVADAVLNKFCINLNELAKKNKIDSLIGRELEIESLVHIASKRKSNNPIMVGDPGVGKTAIAEGLAKSIVEKNVPDTILNSTVYMLDIGALLAGAKFRGDFEERMQLVLAALNTHVENPILFIDEIHMIMGAGSGGTGSMDLANLLKPSLASGKLRCIGSTTLEEYRKFFEKDRALVRRFQRLDINEPSNENAKLILHGIKKYYEDFHKVKYLDSAINAAVDLSERFINDKKLPDKAITMLDAAGARQKIKTKSKRKKSITAKEIEVEISKVARIPEKNVKTSDKNKLKTLPNKLKSTIFGQDAAINILVNSVMVARAGLKDPLRPQGCFLFTGPTGVGKTESINQLGKVLQIPVHRFNMSEYMEKHSVSKLIGTPPGYVGYEDSQGLLINALDSSPHCIILLDEIEKAHPDLVNILLQVMDNGEITNTKGKTVNARNAFIVMTSNAGASENSKNPIGFNRTSKFGEDDKAINTFFTPEFRNRLDAIIKFNELPHNIIIKVVKKFIKELELLASESNVNIKITKKAINWIANKGYDKLMGARPIKRLIDSKIKVPLSTKIVLGDLSNGGTALIDIKNNELVINKL